MIAMHEYCTCERSLSWDRSLASSRMTMFVFVSVYLFSCAFKQASLIISTSYEWSVLKRQNGSKCSQSALSVHITDLRTYLRWHTSILGFFFLLSLSASLEMCVILLIFFLSFWSRLEPCNNFVVEEIMSVCRLNGSCNSFVWIYYSEISETLQIHNAILQ